MLIPFLPLKSINDRFTKELQKSFSDFLESGQYILGPNVSEFEKSFASYCQSNYCVGVANGLDALVLIFEALELKKGAEVIVPANTYFASILAILKAGLSPILVEPSNTDYLISCKNIESKISSKTAAILAVNLYGKMCNFNELAKICEAYTLKLVVDAAQSHGAKYENSKNCEGAIATAYSFYPSKNLGALADAGAIVTDDESLAEKLKALRNYGSDKKYSFKYLGSNSRLSELQAGFLLVKLKYLDDEIHKRRAIANRYLNEIQNANIILPPNNTVFSDTWHLFVLRIKSRTHFINYLNIKKIGHDIHYPIPPHKQESLKKFNSISLPITEKIHEEVVSLPLYSLLTKIEVDYIIISLNAYIS